MAGGRRRLTDAERDLWRRITDDVTRTEQGGQPGMMERVGKPGNQGGKIGNPTGKTGKIKRDKRPAAPPALPAPALPAKKQSDRSARGHLPGLDRKISAKLQRGALSIDARLDLHGMTQIQAHGRLISFILMARKRGDRCVLVITGKGNAKASAQWYERPGVLREMLPHWLAAPELRPLVLSVIPAARHHGGAGACYVYLRRDRRK